MKLAIVCAGRTKQVPDDDKETGLQYIENNFEKVSEALSKNGWTCHTVTPVVPNDYVSTLKTIVTDNNKVDEYIFYYTGHGDYNSDVDFEFQIGSLNSPNECNIAKLISETKRAFGIGHLPKKIAIIIDSCYSGKVLKERPQEDFIEFLTSTNESTQSFEKKGLYPDHQEYGISVFSFLFSEALNSISDVEKINLEHIRDDINNKYNELGYKEQFSYYSPALKRTNKIIVGTNKEINDLLDYFKIYYSNNTENFKKDILSHLETQHRSFEKVIKLDNFQDLFYELFKSEECLYCLLKKIDSRHEYLDKLKIVESCAELKKEVLKSRTIAAIILVIKTDAGDDIVSCTIEGYLECIDGTYFNVQTLTEVNFKTDNYKKGLFNYLSELLEKIYNSEDVLELKLILAEPLFKIDFYNLEIQENSPLPITRKLVEKFNITTKLLVRFENYNVKAFSQKWEKHVKKCKDLESQKITTHLCSIVCKNDISSMDTVFYGGDASSGINIEYVALISNYSLKDKNSLILIINSGLPIVLFPQLNEEERIEVDWLETTIKDIKSTTFRHISKERNINFLHDTYDEAESLQTAINTNQIKDYK